MSTNFASVADGPGLVRVADAVLLDERLEIFEPTGRQRLVWQVVSAASPVVVKSVEG